MEMKDSIVYMDRNESNYGPAPKCFEVIKNADFKLYSYYTRAHEKGMKSILSERLAKDLGVGRDQILLGYGAEDLLKQTVQCFLGKDKKLMVPAYSWWYYKKLASEAGGLNVEYPLIIGQDSYLYDVNTMLEMYNKEKPEIVLISSPNNPTGNALSNDDLAIILENMKDTIVVLDEAYLNYDHPINVKNLISNYPNLIIIRTFSKYFALAGIRIGYAVVGENLSALTTLMNRYLGYHRMSEAIAIAALDSPEYYLDLHNKMKEDKKLFYSELGKLPGFKVFKSETNFILVELPKEIMPGLKAFLNERGLVIKFMDEEIINSHLRITLGTQEQNRMLIDAIKEFINR
jgi:histidinol-phosphate aminotransferase